MKPFGQWFHDFTPKPTKEWLDLKAWKEKRIAKREDYNTEGEDDVQCCVCEDWFTPDYEFDPEDDLEEHYCGKSPNCCPLTHTHSINRKSFIICKKDDTPGLTPPGTIMRFYQASAPKGWTFDKVMTEKMRLLEELK